LTLTGVRFFAVRYLLFLFFVVFASSNLEMTVAVWRISFGLRFMRGAPPTRRINLAEAGTRLAFQKKKENRRPGR
jgi:hypothetical protein